MIHQTGCGMGATLAFLLSGVLLSGCEVTRADRPPQIRYGEQPCATCHMLISEERFAAAVATSGGTIELFDEIGCLLDYRTRHPGSVARSWVHDYTSGQWLDADHAFFVHSDEVATPMGHGFVAFATHEAAERLARTAHGTVVRFAQLIEEERS